MPGNVLALEAAEMAIDFRADSWPLEDRNYALFCFLVADKTQKRKIIFPLSERERAERMKQVARNFSTQATPIEDNSLLFFIIIIKP